MDRDTAYRLGVAILAAAVRGDTEAIDALTADLSREDLQRMLPPLLTGAIAPQGDRDEIADGLAAHLIEQEQSGPAE